MRVEAGGARASGTVTVIGDTIEFSPETDAEAPWLFERDGSQFDGNGRYADGANHYTYRFELPADVTGGTFTLHMHAEFLVRASTDNQSWTTVLPRTGGSPTAPTTATTRSISTRCGGPAGRSTCASRTRSPTTAGAPGSRT